MDPRESYGGNLSAVVKSNMHNPIPVKHTNVIPTNIDHIPSNTTNSGSSAMLYVFEDNEAVIKKIIKGRSPTMRHVSLTHRVALDWLFDRINLDSKTSERKTQKRASGVASQEDRHLRKHKQQKMINWLCITVQALSCTQDELPVCRTCASSQHCIVFARSGRQQRV